MSDSKCTDGLQDKDDFGIADVKKDFFKIKRNDCEKVIELNKKHRKMSGEKVQKNIAEKKDISITNCTNEITLRTFTNCFYRLITVTKTLLDVNE